MTIPFRVKKLTETAKLPEQANEGDLFDLFANDFCVENIKEYTPINRGLDGNFQGDYEEYHYEKWHRDFREEISNYNDCVGIKPSRDDVSNYQLQSFRKLRCDVEIAKDRSRVTLWKGARILVKTGIALELPKQYDVSVTNVSRLAEKWFYKKPKSDVGFFNLKAYAVADLRPRSGLALKHGITVLNSPGTIDNSYNKEIGVILINQGHEPYTISKGDKIAQMLIRPLYPSIMEEVKNFKDSGRGGFGSTGK